MKQFFLLLITLFTMSKGFSQTLFTYGTDQVNKDEFLRAYNKNKTAVPDKEKALREYLDLYSKFKLKVKAAAALRLDTLQQLKYDVQNFRGQVEETYLTDEKEVNRLVDEAFVRSQKDLHVLHFYVPINNKMSAADTVKAHRAIDEAREDLVKGKTNYDDIVDEISSDITDIKGKDLGYVTALTLPYDIENLVYSLKTGEVSKVHRTKSALHVFKITDERKSAGKWKVAQILLAVPPDINGQQLKILEKMADSIYGELKAGANFPEMAKKFSDDRITYLSGGEMPEFGTGKFELPFETAVFALQKDSDISKPIFTGYGFHIIKRLQQRPIPTDKNDEAYLASLKQLVLLDDRINIAKANFIKNIMAKTGFKRTMTITDEQLFRYADSVTANKELGKYPINNSVIFSFTKSKVKGSDWLNFVKDYKLNTDVYKGEDNKALLQKYISTIVVEYYRKHMEEFNEDFKYQMQEFKEGNMLFEVMERNVWSKAANDSVGLKKFYENNKGKYIWAESAAVNLFNSNSLHAAQEATAALLKGKTWKEIADGSDGTTQADSGRYELSQLQLPAGVAPKEGFITAPQINTSDNTASFVKLLRIYPAGDQRTFEEAKGLVINDYQNFLEEKWLAELRKRYPVKVNETVFKSLLQ
jgi:peptidyl-prolyl cis-trans isomerase SurA